MIPLVDTNVLLDVLDRREPFYAVSASVWALAEQRKLRFLVAAISFNNLFYVLRKRDGRAKAREAVAMVAAVFEVAPVDAAVISEAIGSPVADFEDAVQAVSARLAGADVIVTRDPRDFALAGLQALTPETFLARALAELPGS